MTGDRAYPKPLPKPSDLTRPFWEAAKRHELLIQRCSACGRYVFYPRPICDNCLSPDLQWTRVSGKGRVYSYTVIRQAASKRFAPDVPYLFAIVELAEGPRMATNLVDCPLERARVGLPVEVFFDDVTDEYALVKFRPVE
ncbi:MAG TPA: Zn-ribbon domain-containing OB-fold protein [Dehalococcoidia bacterium]|nr:Zn-ribbon domain-containing OB-fold protein [Dehalococcoidia bacterium]